MERNAEIIAGQMWPSRRIVCRSLLKRTTAKTFRSRLNSSIVNDFCSFSGLWYLLSCFIYPFEQPQLNVHCTTWTFLFAHICSRWTNNSYSLCLSLLVFRFFVLFCGEVRIFKWWMKWNCTGLNLFAMALSYISLFAIIFHFIYLTHSFDTCFRFDFIFIRLNQTVDLYWFRLQILQNNRYDSYIKPTQ